jgi:hypothetical protein
VASFAPDIAVVCKKATIPAGKVSGKSGVHDMSSHFKETKLGIGAPELACKNDGFIFILS